MLHNREAKLSACAYISQVWGQFPCLKKAVMRKAGCTTALIALTDFPAIVLGAEMKSQLGAYIILRESARAAAAEGGLGGAVAAGILGAEFRRYHAR